MTARNSVALRIKVLLTHNASSKDQAGLNQRKRSTLFLGSIAAILYFSEGLPYGMVKEFVPLYLRVRHVDLTSIGLINVVGFAWTLKFLWSPLVDVAVHAFGGAGATVHSPDPALASANPAC